MSSSKIHEEDYRRETQMNVPMLGPEILAVFANSQIFQDHQPNKLNRSNTKTFLAGVHLAKDQASTKESDQDKLIRRLEDNLETDVPDSKQFRPVVINVQNPTPEKRIKFTITPDSSPEGSRSLTSKQFESIAEELTQKENYNDRESNEVILRPRLIDLHPHLKYENSYQKKPLRNVKSVPYINVRPSASETDIFAITGSAGQISMTPEVPSISFLNLPKNYEDTPTIEQYRVSQSLYSIQAANEAKAGQVDYSMPRYFGRSAKLGQSIENFVLPTSISPQVQRPEKDKSKRLQLLRENLPPLLIHSTRKKEEAS